MKFILSTVIIFIALGCNQCKNGKEPWLFLEVNSFKNYTHFRVPNDVNYYPITNSLVPLAISKDTTFLLLKNQTNTDSISITYNRIFTYQKGNCGYLIHFEDMKLDTINSSFKKGKFSEITNSDKNYSYAFSLLN